MIELEHVTKTYLRDDGTPVPALRDISCRITAGEFVTIRGASGSGKSSLLNILGCLDTPTSGTYRLGGEDVSGYTDRERSAIRARRIGFVFQSFNLLARTTAVENVEVPALYSGGDVDRGKALELLKRVGLAERSGHFVTELSGGEQQRVAIARALMNDPPLLLADEPTGNLDSAVGDSIMELLTELNREGRTIVLVTHDERVASYAARELLLRDGIIASDRAQGPRQGGASRELNMSWAKQLALALRTLRRNPLRSLFMMLGTAVGIASLIAMASVGEATRQETLRQFKRMVGTFDTISIQPGGPRTRGMPSLTTVEPTLRFEDAAAIEAEIPNIRRVALGQTAFDIDVQYRDRIATTAIFGASENWMDIRGLDVSAGRGISAEDVENIARVVVIGEDLRADLFPGEDPIGKTLRIADVPFQVQGVLMPRGVGPGGSSLDDLLVMPVSTASKRLFKRDYLTNVTVQLKDPEQYAVAVAAIETLLRERHGIVPPVEDDFIVSNPRAGLARVTQVDTTLSRVLTGVAVIATLIGGVVIMSLMLIAVSERRREIGVRRALGATRGDVLRQFLVEAALISALGGAAGVLLGLAGATAAAFRQQLPPAFLWGAMAGAVVLAALVGLVFGLQPAWRAARVDPIQALRT